MKIAQLSFPRFKKILTSGLAAVATIIAIGTASLPNAQAQISAGRYEAQPNGQIFFYPANGNNPVVTYNGRQRALAIVQCGDALYTAFDGGGIYRSPDGQNLGGGGNTERVYSGSQLVNRMQCSNRGSVITTFSGGGVYESPDGRNLGGGGQTFRLN